MNGPICFFGKLTTATTSVPGSSSTEYRSVICALDFLTPNSSPKSISRIYAGLRASGNGRAERTRPTRSSTFSNSSQLIVMMSLRLYDGAGLEYGRDIQVFGIHHLGNAQQRRLEHLLLPVFQFAEAAQELRLQGLRSQLELR